MPAMRRKGGWSWGKSGKIYRGKGAKEKALRQGRAIKTSQARAEGGTRKGKYTRIRRMRTGIRKRR